MIKIKSEIRLKENAKKWREKNKEYYNNYMREYMREYKKKQNLKFKNRTSYGVRKLEKKNSKLPIVSFNNNPVILIFE